MEDGSFSRLGQDIISVVRLAVEGQWSKAEELHEKVTAQVSKQLQEGLENLSPTQQKKRRQSGQRCEHVLAHVLASVLTVEGRWRQAETLLRELLQLARRRLPAGAVDMLNSMTLLTTVLDEQGKLREVEQIHREAMQISCKHFGKDHPNTLSKINNLALCPSKTRQAARS